MGACTSGANDGPEADEFKAIPAPELVRIASMQRRKLSVSGSHVGDLNNPLGVVDPKQGFVDVSVGAATTLLTQCCLSRKGVIPYSKQKTNQDRFISKFGIQGDPQINLFGVMDGHGHYGHLVSQFIQDHLIRCLEMCDIRADPQAAILNGVKVCCQELKKTAIDLSFSGSTLVFGLVIGTEDEAKNLTRRIYCANIGDSRGVLVYDNNEGQHVTKPLSIDQKPDLPQERARIEAAGGRIATIQGPPGEELGPMRVWLKNLEVPGLAMSRSVGDDISQQVGVISVPEITVHEVQPTDEYAIWATDGVWEFVSNQEAADIIMNAKGDLTKACQVLVDEATHRWREREEVIDDITCVVVDLWSIPKKPSK